MGPIWDPSGQPVYGITHMGPMRSPVALPIWVAHMGPIYACLLGIFSYIRRLGQFFIFFFLGGGGG